MRAAGEDVLRLWSGHPHRLNDLEDGGADDYEDKEGNKFRADRVLVIVLAGSFHLDVYWLFVFWASDCSYFGQKMTPIVPNTFCFATNNSTLTLKPRVKIKDHPTWPLLVTFLAFFSFAFLICGVDGI